jgi:hypothetical protein
LIQIRAHKTAVFRVRRVIAITDRSKNKFAIGWLAYGNPPLK